MKIKIPVDKNLLKLLALGQCLEIHAVNRGDDDPHILVEDEKDKFLNQPGYRPPLFYKKKEK